MESRRTPRCGRHRSQIFGSLRAVEDLARALIRLERLLIPLRGLRRHARHLNVDVERPDVVAQSDQIVLRRGTNLFPLTFTARLVTKKRQARTTIAPESAGKPAAPKSVPGTRRHRLPIPSRSLGRHVPRSHSCSRATHAAARVDDRGSRRSGPAADVLRRDGLCQSVRSRSAIRSARITYGHEDHLPMAACYGTTPRFICRAISAKRGPRGRARSTTAQAMSGRDASSRRRGARRCPPTDERRDPHR